MVYIKYILHHNNLYIVVYTMYIMVKTKIQVELNTGDEIIEREIKGFGNASHIILPQKHKGSKATIIINHKKK